MNCRDDIVAYLKANADALCEDSSKSGSFIELDMFYDPTVDDDLIERMVACAAFARLQSIRIPESNISDAAFQWLSKLTELTHLDCNSSRLTDVAATYIETMVQLESLSISETSMGDLSAQVIGQLPRLETLVMGSCRLTDVGCASLSRSQSLTHLYVQRNRLTNHCVAFFQEMPQLKFLNIVDTQVTADAVAPLKNRGVYVEVRPITA